MCSPQTLRVTQTFYLTWYPGHLLEVVDVPVFETLITSISLDSFGLVLPLLRDLLSDTITQIVFDRKLLNLVCWICDLDLQSQSQW